MARENFDAFNQSTLGREQAGRASALAILPQRDFAQLVPLNRHEIDLAVGLEPTKSAIFATPSLDFMITEPDLEEPSVTIFDRKTLPSRLQADTSHGYQIKPTPNYQNEFEQIPVHVVYRVVLGLMEREQVSLARKILDALPVGRFDDPTIAKLRNLLAVPTTRTSLKRDVDRTLDYKWIREHAQEYSGHWVAVSNGQLMVTATSLRDLLERINSLGLKQRPLLHQIPS